MVIYAFSTVKRLVVGLKKPSLHPRFRYIYVRTKRILLYLSDIYFQNLDNDQAFIKKKSLFKVYVLQFAWVQRKVFFFKIIDSIFFPRWEYNARSLFYSVVSYYHHMWRINRCLLDLLKPFLSNWLLCEEWESIFSESIIIDQ